MPPLFVLIHSPLVGPLTWALVVEQLRDRGADAVAPSLLGTDRRDGPHWQRHVAAITLALRDVPAHRRVVLVAHSGAGPLMPAIGQGIGQDVAGYVFVDAGLPGNDGQSRLDLFDPADADRFRQAAVGGMLPSVWRDEALLRAIGIEDACLRRRFAAEVPDVPLAVYEEPLPVPSDWPAAPCGYLQFSAPYKADGRDAERGGWAFRVLRGGHFHMLVDPPAVAATLLDLIAELGISDR